MLNLHFANFFFLQIWIFSWVWLWCLYVSFSIKRGHNYHPATIMTWLQLCPGHNYALATTILLTMASLQCFYRLCPWLKGVQDPPPVQTVQDTDCWVWTHGPQGNWCSISMEVNGLVPFMDTGRDTHKIEMYGMTCSAQWQTCIKLVHHNILANY